MNKLSGSVSKDVLIIMMDEKTLSEPELARVKKELEEATGAKVVTVSKKLGCTVEIQYLFPPIQPSIVK